MGLKNMLKINRSLLFIALIFAVMFSTMAEASREVDFNFGWKFHKGDVKGAEAVNFADGKWRGLDVPHDWSIEGPFNKKWASGTGYLPAGIGWYRKHFTVAKADEGKKVYIYFGGVYNNSEVWINGHLLGKRPNGYISFYYEMSKHIRFGGENVIAVKVDHTHFADSRWYTGSGIYRNVKLVTTDAVGIKPWGVYAVATLPSANKGLLETEVSVTNGSKATVKVTVENKLLLDGKVIAKSEQPVTISAGQTAVVEGKMEVGNPKLWDVEDPTLYTLASSVRKSGKVLDEVETKTGFRTIRFDADKGFFLNGKNMKLKGICIHHDAGTLGTAIPLQVMERRLNVAKGLGSNAIRTSHNAFSSEFYQLCDEMGLLVIDEVFDEWEKPKKKWVRGWNSGNPSKHGYAEYFTEWHEADLRDQVLRDRNHPCIIMWSIGNEIDYPHDPYSHESLNDGDNPQTWAKFDKKLPYGSRLGEIAKELVGIVKEYDTTRPVTAGLASAIMSNAVGYADALDVVGYNYQEFRYEKDHAAYPKRVLYGSENGMALDAWKAVSDNDYIVGQFLWTGIEYMGEAGQYPKRNSTSGVIDLAGHMKGEAYFRQSLWSDEPMVFIGSSKLHKDTVKRKSLWAHHRVEPAWNWKDGQTVNVTAFSNCNQVELFLNGKSLGRKKMEGAVGNQLSWEVPFKAGTLRAVGINNGKTAAEFKLQTAGKPKQLMASGDKSTLKADRKDVSHVEVVIADEKGLPVFSAKNRIKCEISGPIRLLGMEGADSRNVENYKDDKQDAYKGRLMVYIQSLDKKGTGKIKLTSRGLKSAEITIAVK
jgi:beta-galactosidase